MPTLGTLGRVQRFTGQSEAPVASIGPSTASSREATVCFFLLQGTMALLGLSTSYLEET